MSNLLPILTMNDFTETEQKELKTLEHLRLMQVSAKTLLKFIDPSARPVFDFLVDEMDQTIANHKQTLEHKARVRMVLKSAGPKT